MNLLADIPYPLLEEAHETVKCIKANPLGYLPTDIGEICDLGSYLISCMNSILNVLGELSWQIVTQFTIMAKLTGLVKTEEVEEPPLD